MKRFFFQISYDGTPFSGWQKQNNAASVQAIIEDSLSKLLSQSIEIVGCGRTDAQVHSDNYYFHADLPDADLNSETINFRLNKMLPSEVAVKNIFPVHNDAHARFDAESRSYRYCIHFDKNPFNNKYSYKYNQSKKPDFNRMNEGAHTLLKYESFFPFCKTHSDVLNYNCKLTLSEWIMIDELNWEFHISANRFLRGMVRLIVGMCINVAIGKLTIKEVNESLIKQERLKYSWSVPANGLSLVDITYPYIKCQ